MGVVHPYLVGLLPSSDRPFKKSPIACVWDWLKVKGVYLLPSLSLSETVIEPIFFVNYFQREEKLCNLCLMTWRQAANLWKVPPPHVSQLENQVSLYHRNRTRRTLSVSLCMRFCYETILMDARTPFFYVCMAKYFAIQWHHHWPMNTLETVYVRRHLAIHACHVMLILPYVSHAMITLPYTRIARHPYAASTDNTEGGRAQRSPGSISMVPYIG